MRASENYPALEKPSKEGRYFSGTPLQKKREEKRNMCLKTLMGSIPKFGKRMGDVARLPDFLPGMKCDGIP